MLKQPARWIGALALLALIACGGRSVRHYDGDAGASSDDGGSSTGAGGSGQNGGTSGSTGGSAGGSVNAATGGTAPAAGGGPSGVGGAGGVSGSSTSVGGTAGVSGSVGTGAVGGTGIGGTTAPGAGGGPAGSSAGGVAGAAGSSAMPCDTSGWSLPTMCPAMQVSILDDPTCRAFFTCLIGWSCAASCDACLEEFQSLDPSTFCIPADQAAFLPLACQQEAEQSMVCAL